MEKAIRASCNRRLYEKCWKICFKKVLVILMGKCFKLYFLKDFRLQALLFRYFIWSFFLTSTFSLQYWDLRCEFVVMYLSLLLITWFHRSHGFVLVTATNHLISLLTWFSIFSWFHHGIDGVAATKLLQSYNRGNGSFLVRESSAGGYSITFWSAVVLYLSVEDRFWSI